MGLEEREQRRSAVGAMVSRTKEETEAQKKRGRKKKTAGNLVQRGYYLTPEIAQRVKMRAVMDGKNDYEIVQEALEAYLK